MEDEFGEGIGNPFDTPVPGQSLTDKPGNYPWEHPPAIAQPDDAADYIWDKITEPERAEEIIAMLDAGVPVEAIGRSILFGGFMKGTFTPDVAFLIAEPVMKMVATIGYIAEIKDIKISMNDVTNKNELRSAVQIKVAAKDAGENVKEEIQQKGLMAKPNEEEME